MSDELTICAKCIHRRRRKLVSPFRHVSTWTPGLYEAKRKWDEEQRELALAERHRFQSGDEFDYEPHYFDWCDKWTNEQGRLSIDPLTGDTSPLYVLCARANAKGDCRHFKRDEDGQEDRLR